MERLCGKLLEKPLRCERTVTVGAIADRPEKVIQFGEGNFLRGFVDWMVNVVNRESFFNGDVVIIQPIEKGMVDILNEQDGFYTVLLRGIEDGRVIEKADVITCVSRGIDPYKDWTGFLECANNPELRFVISNTTEAGIVYVKQDRPVARCAESFPAKLAEFLYRRFECFDGTGQEKGMVILPCELIEANGDNLKRCVLKHAEHWGLGDSFIEWVKESNCFLNTLVDRIVSGYPVEEIEAVTQSLGYVDKMLVTGEIFGLWVIEGDQKLDEELGFSKAGLDVVWCDDISPYRQRKVRILNGAHTMMCPAAYLYGKETVGQCMEDELIRRYLRKGIFEEILPGIELDEKHKRDFAEMVLERFSNPYLKHRLLSICMNSVSKFRVRVLVSLLDYAERKGRLPDVLSFSLAGLIAFYRGTEIADGRFHGCRAGQPYELQDEPDVLEFFARQWRAFESDGEPAGFCRKILGNRDLWQRDLNEVDGLCEKIAGYLDEIIKDGMETAIRKVI